MPGYHKDHSISFSSRSFGRSWLDGWTAPPAYTSASRQLVLKRVLDGTRLPSWKQILAAGGNATTPMTATFDTVDAVPWGNVTQKWRYNANPNWIYIQELRGDVGLTNGADQFGPTDPVADTSFVENLARAKYFSRLKDLTTSFDGLVFAGELKETLALLKSPTRAIMNLGEDFLRTVKNRKRANPRRWRNDLGSAWLEQAYGWKPLINDAQAAVETFLRLTEPRLANLKRINVSVKKPYDTSSSLTGYKRAGGLMGSVNGDGFIIDVLQGSRYEYVTIRYRSGVKVLTDGAPKWYDQDLWGFSPANWIPSAWNLLPWSFLADYVTNVGDMLESMCVRHYDLAYCSRTMIRESFQTRVLAIRAKSSIGIDTSQYTHMGISGDTSPKLQTASRKVVSRSQESGVLLPSFQVNWDLTDGQKMNIAALLGTANSIHPQNGPSRFRR